MSFVFFFIYSQSRLANNQTPPSDPVERKFDEMFRASPIPEVKSRSL